MTTSGTGREITIARHRLAADGAGAVITGGDGTRGEVYVARVGFWSRLLIPRGVRRAMHPGRAVKRAVTPRPVKQLKHAMHPVDNAIYGVERSFTTKHRRSSRAPVYRHGTCTVNHRTPEAAARCRRTY